MLDNDEYQRWIRAAESTYQSARSDKDSQFYSWSCFKCQQAAEYAVKAYLRGRGDLAFGHSVSGLSKSAHLGKTAIDLAKVLDKYYIPTRYTDSWAEGTPEDYYTLRDAEEACEVAKELIEKVKSKWKSLKEEEKKEKR